jgi:hypothetical protein
MVNVPVAVALVVVLPLAILLTLVLVVVNAIRRRPIHGIVSMVVILACLGGTVYGTVCLIMHATDFVEEKVPAFPAAVKSATDTGAVVVKEGIRAGSTAVVQGASEAADEIKGKWSEADLATARSLKLKLVRLVPARAEGGTAPSAVVLVENPTARSIDLSRLVSQGLILGVDADGIGYPATAINSQLAVIAPGTRLLRTFTFEAEGPVTLVGVRAAGGAAP